MILLLKFKVKNLKSKADSFLLSTFYFLPERLKGATDVSFGRS